MRRYLIVSLLVAIGMLGSCAPSPKPFNSGDWKRGSQSLRGAMVHDIIEHSYLIGKSRLEVENLLGRPDYQQDDWFGYGVITIARCHLWECRMDISFNPESSLATSVSVSD